MQRFRFTIRTVMPSERPLFRMAFLAALLVAAFCGTKSLAQSGGGYDLSWNSIDGRGETSTGGGYSLTGVIGQPDAGTLTGGAYTLQGGFLAVTIAPNNAAMFWQIYD
jgi:hypothetical protein